jgi:hypothetical protein
MESRRPSVPPGKYRWGIFGLKNEAPRVWAARGTKQGKNNRWDATRAQRKDTRRGDGAHGERPTDARLRMTPPKRSGIMETGSGGQGRGGPGADANAFTKLSLSHE